MSKNNLTSKFLRNGYLISKIENIKNFKKIEKEIFLITKKFLKIKEKNIQAEYLFNNLHKYIKLKDLNKLRLLIYKELNLKKWFKNTYFSLASKTIELIIGNEIAIQKNINISIQLPNDESSKLGLHADSLSGESKFQIVLWIPLVNAYKTKSMYVFNKQFSQKCIKNLKNYKFKGMEELYKKNQSKKKFLKVERGQFLIFSPNLLHGNVKNLTSETRISMNGRFKNLFSTYGDISQIGKRLGYFYLPFRVKPITQFSQEFEIPDEF